MKTGGIWKVLSLCAIGLLFLASSFFVESEPEAVLSSSKIVATPVGQGIAPKTIDTVVIKGMMFKPNELHVHKGDIVVWINEDIVPHNITDFPENKWTSGTLKRGSSWKKTIDEAFDYYCSIHPTMRGAIIVEP